MGLHTIPLAKLVGENGRVAAFEPLPSICSHLREITKGMRQVDVWDAALSEWDCKRPFVEIVDAPWLSSAKARHLGEPHQTRTITVQHHRLDQYAFWPTTFIKLDLEGGEYHALAGGERLLETPPPVLP